MSNYEHCCECNERTGRAGPSDDSLYLGSVGPFCEDCVDTWPDKMTEEYGRLMAMNAELTEEIELLQHALSWKGKMLSAIVNIVKGQPEENSLHSTHDVVESVERLQERVAELECKTCDGHGMIGGPSYSQPDEGGEPCPDCTGMIRPATKAFILRKQAEAVEDFSFHLFVECQAGSNEDSDAHRKAYSEFFVKRLRNEAENTGGTEK